MKQTKLTDEDNGGSIDQRLAELDQKIEYLIEALHDFRYRRRQLKDRGDSK